MSTWILLRGLSRESRHWGGFPDLLRRQFPHSQLLALDLPGSGEHNSLISPTNVIDMASYCRHELARRGISPPYRLLGISMGGMVATAWAQQHPGEIEACVLINTSFGTFSPLRDRLRPGAWPFLLQILLAKTVRYREQLVFKLTSRLEKAPSALLDEWVAIRVSRPVRMVNTLRQLIAAARFNAPSIAPVPTLLLASAGDRLVDACCSKEIARRWKCVIAVQPVAGHDLPLDDGEWATSEIREWMLSESFGKPNTSMGAAPGPLLV